MEIALHEKSMDQDTSTDPPLRSFLRSISSFGGVLAARLLGRAQTASDSALQIEQRLSLGSKRMLYLIRCREKEFLIATGNDAPVTILKVSPEEHEQIADPASAPMKRVPKRERAS